MNDSKKVGLETVAEKPTNTLQELLKMWQSLNICGRVGEERTELEEYSLAFGSEPRNHTTRRHILEDHKYKMHYRFTTAPPLVCPESDESHPHPHTLFLEDPIDRLSAQVSKMISSLKIMQPEHIRSIGPAVSAVLI